MCSLIIILCFIGLHTEGLTQISDGFKGSNLALQYLKLGACIKDSLQHIDSASLKHILEEVYIHLRSSAWGQLNYLLTFLGNIFLQSSPLAKSLFLQNTPVIHYLINNGLNFPSESVKASIIYLLYTLEFVPVTTHEIQCFSQKIYSCLLKAETRTLQVNILSLIIKILKICNSDHDIQFAEQRMEIFISKDLILSLKSTILSHDIDIQILSLQVVFELSMKSQFSPLLIENDFLEFLSENIINAAQTISESDTRPPIILNYALFSLLNLVRYRDLIVERRNTVADIVDVIFEAFSANQYIDPELLIVALNIIHGITSISLICKYIKASILFQIVVHAIKTYTTDERIVGIAFEILGIFIDNIKGLSQDHITVIEQLLQSKDFYLASKTLTVDIYPILKIIEGLSIKGERNDGLVYHSLSDLLLSLCNFHIIEYLKLHDMNEECMIMSLKILSNILSIDLKGLDVIFRGIIDEGFFKLLLDIIVQTEEEMQQYAKHILYYTMKRIDAVGQSVHLKSWRLNLLKEKADTSFGDLMKYLEVQEVIEETSGVETLIDVIYIVTVLKYNSHSELQHAIMSLSSIINSKSNLSQLDAVSLLRLAYIYLASLETVGEDSIESNRLKFAISCVEYSLNDVYTMASDFPIPAPDILIRWLWQQENLSEQNRLSVLNLLTSMDYSTPTAAFWVEFFVENESGLKILMSILMNPYIEVGDTETLSILEFLLHCFETQHEAAIQSLIFYGLFDKFVRLISLGKITQMENVLNILLLYLKLESKNKDGIKDIFYVDPNFTLILDGIYYFIKGADIQEVQEFVLKYLNLLILYQNLNRSAGGLRNHTEILEWICSMLTDSTIVLLPAVLQLCIQIGPLTDSLKHVLELRQDILLALIQHPYRLIAVLSIQMLMSIQNLLFDDDIFQRIVFSMLNNLLDSNEMILNISMKYFHTKIFKDDSLKDDLVDRLLTYPEIHKALFNMIHEKKFIQEIKFGHILYFDMFIKLSTEMTLPDYIYQALTDENTHRLIISLLSTSENIEECHLLLRLIRGMLYSSISTTVHPSSKTALSRLLLSFSNKTMHRHVVDSFTEIDGVIILPPCLEILEERSLKLKDIIEEAQSIRQENLKFFEGSKISI